MIKLKLTGEPKSTNHIYKITAIGGFARSYMSADGKALKESYQWETKSQYHGKPLEGPLEVSFEIYFGTKRKQDIDNYSKILLDSLSGIVWVDDSQIQKLAIRKNYDKQRPRIEIEIREL